MIKILIDVDEPANGIRLRTLLLNRLIESGMPKSCLLPEEPTREIEIITIKINARILFHYDYHRCQNTSVIHVYRCSFSDMIRLR